MASNINVVVIDGNLTRDSELRQSQGGGSAILTFGVAVNDRRRNSQTGEWENYANYVDVVLFGNRAQALAPYLTKGQKVCVQGKLRWSQWERDGVKKSKIEVIADEISLMSQRGGNQQPQQYAPAAPQAAPAAPQAAPTYSPQPQAAPQPAQGYAAGQGAYQQPIQQQFDANIVVQEEDIPF